MRKPFPVVLPALLCAAFLIVADAAEAQGPKLDDPELAGVSDVIVTGDVVGKSSARDLTTGLIYTYVHVRVDERLKGWVTEDEIIVKQLGGYDGGQWLVIPDQAEFTVGEEVLLFLVERPRDGTAYTTGFWQGKWSIDRDPATGAGSLRRTPLRESDLARFRDPAALRAAAAYQDVRLLEPFLAELREWVGDTPLTAPQRALDLRPAEAPPPVAPVGDGPGVRAKFVLLGCTDDTDDNCQSGTPARWHEADNGTSVKVDIQDGGQPDLTGGGLAEIATARGLWNNVSGSSLILAPGNNSRGAGSTKAQLCTDTQNVDGRLAIFFSDPCDEIASDGTLAIGGFFSSSSTVKTIGGVRFLKISKGFIMNNDGGQAIGNLTVSRCFQDVETHELGHAFGLGHTPVPGAMMAANIDPACHTAAAAGNGAVKAAITGALATDDKNAIKAVYPGSSTPPPTGSGKPGKPRNLSHTLVTDRVIFEWDPPLTGGAVGSYQILGGSDPGRKNLANFDTFQNATKINLKIGAGEYHVRIAAKNSAGQSDQTSNEISFIVTDLPSIPNPVFVEPTINFATDAQGDVMVLGEIQNRVIGGISPTFLQVNATFFGPGGNTVGTDSTFLMGRSRRLRDTGVITHTALLPGQRGCFMMFTDIPAGQVSSVELQGVFSQLDHDAVAGRLRIGTYMQQANGSGNLQMVGTASNVGSVPSSANRAIFDVKTPMVQTCDFAYINGSKGASGLSPGQVGPFTNDTTIPFQSIEVRRFTNWESAGGAASSVLQAAMKADPELGAQLARLQADRTRLEELDRDPNATREQVHRLRNDIEKRLRVIEERLAPDEAARAPFAEPIVVPVRVGGGQ